MKTILTREEYTVLMKLKSAEERLAALMEFTREFYRVYHLCGSLGQRQYYARRAKELGVIALDVEHPAFHLGR